MNIKQFRHTNSFTNLNSNHQSRKNIKTLNHSIDRRLEPAFVKCMNKTSMTNTFKNILRNEKIIHVNDFKVDRTLLRSSKRCDIENKTNGKKLLANRSISYERISKKKFYRTNKNMSTIEFVDITQGDNTRCNTQIEDKRRKPKENILKNHNMVRREFHIKNLFLDRKNLETFSKLNYLKHKEVTKHRELKYPQVRNNNSSRDKSIPKNMTRKESVEMTRQAMRKNYSRCLDINAYMNSNNIKRVMNWK